MNNIVDRIEKFIEFGASMSPKAKMKGRQLVKDLKTEIERLQNAARNAHSLSWESDPANVGKYTACLDGEVPGPSDTVSKATKGRVRRSR